MLSKRILKIWYRCGNKRFYQFWHAFWIEIFHRLHDSVYTINRVNLAKDWSKMTDQSYCQANAHISQNISIGYIIFFYWTIFNNGSCQKFSLVSIENSYDRWVKLKLTSNDFILAQYEIKELKILTVYIHYIKLLERISVDFLKIFGFYFWPKPSFENFSRTLPVFPRIYFQNSYFSIFKRSNFEFTNH